MKPKKILFATLAYDGHFNPLTSIAMHLKDAGHDVRWYTGSIYAQKLKSLGISHYPFKKALDVHQLNTDQLFPERTAMRSEVRKLQFDIQNIFILRAFELYEDIRDLHETFAFNLLVSDIVFPGIPFVREKMNIPVVAIGIIPITETSIDLAPTGLAMPPSTSFFGRKKQHVLRFVADRIFFGKLNTLFRKILEEHGIKSINGNIFDVLYRKSSLVLQSGTPSFEYARSDLGKNIRFVGPILPYRAPGTTVRQFDQEKLAQYKKVILVTQGTVEKDLQKILVPTLEAFSGGDYFVIVCTGGSGTAALRERYPQKNVMIEDFIPFAEIMPHADVFISNGGYGGILMAIEHGLPLVVAGVHEGKNEVNARIGHFQLGIDLKTEYPSATQIKKSVETVLRNAQYACNVQKLRLEFQTYNSNILCEKYIADLMEGTV